MASLGDPDLTVERELMRRLGGPIISMDEVGRGALAGPVAVGAVLLTPDTELLSGVRDSKLLSPARRTGLRALLAERYTGAVGLAAASEVDEYSVTGALRLAGMRALAQLPVPTGILLDGSHNWLSTPLQPSLVGGHLEGPAVPVQTRVKADLTCWGVAAASILAKVVRDDLMRDAAAEYPEYGFEQHKGYGTDLHRQAIARHGLTPEHRHTWTIRPSKEAR